jgi:deoxyribodipyrimidine photolyase-related protein
MLRARDRSRGPRDRRWIFVPYDQLNHRFGPLASTPPGETGIVMIESRAKADRRPYHKQKLALVLANQRQFALEQADRGVAVRYVMAEDDYATVLRELSRELGRITMMRAAERELRAELRPCIADGIVEELPHAGWLTDRDIFRRSQRSAPWRMQRFYETVRRESGILMEPNGRPVGGRFSFDTENRRRWRGEPRPPQPLRFVPDPILTEVGELVARDFASHPGQLDLTSLPTTAADAARVWSHALLECLPWFGPFEDAMSVSETTLFHTRISPLLNLHRLLPRDVVDDAVAAHLPLASKEGFVRQVLGWREFMRHVHEETDGFRSLPKGSQLHEHGEPLPAAFWGRPSGLACLDHVVDQVWREGYSHHITRLMILGNLATLLEVSPRELSDWFWVAYTDAFDWVVEPNVLGMASLGLPGLFTTKPYVSGAAYIDRMSDFCGRCRFDQKRDCPITPMYWAWLARHREELIGNPRMALPLRSLARRTDAQQAADQRVWRETLARMAGAEPR